MTEEVAGQEIIETARLKLRQLRPTDLPFLVELFGSLEVMRFSLSGPLSPPQTREIQDRFLVGYATQPLAVWGVIEKVSGVLIGLCGFLKVCVETDEWELAYRFLPPFWGRGYATEAAAACRDLAFRHPKVSAIYALIEAEHQASIKVAKKIGLQRVGVTQVQSVEVVKYFLSHHPTT